MDQPSGFLVLFGLLRVFWTSIAKCSQERERTLQ